MKKAHRSRPGDTRADVTRALTEFLAIPGLTVLFFVLLAIGTCLLDRQPSAMLEPTREFLRNRFVTDPDTTNTLLGTMAGAVITVTSITFSLLLLTVQQSATALTNQVLDQFLQRRLNQVYFGVFVGVSLFALLILATNDTRIRPVFGAAITLIMVAFSLVTLVLLVYTTLNQMRSERIIGSIHDAALEARIRQQELLERTRQLPQLESAPAVLAVRAKSSGFFAGVDLDAIGGAALQAGPGTEVVLRIRLGDFVSFDDIIADISADSAESVADLPDVIRRSVSLERQRSFTRDPGFGVMQLSTLGWTSISTAKSNPQPGMSAIRHLRDLLVRWLAEADSQDRAAGNSPLPLPIVYKDPLLEEIIDAFESLLVVSSESLQHQCAAEVYRSFASVFSRLDTQLQDRAERAILTGLSSLGDHVLTFQLNAALLGIIGELTSAGRLASAQSVERARTRLAETIGSLGSRDTRSRGAQS